MDINNYYFKGYKGQDVYREDQVDINYTKDCTRQFCAYAKVHTMKLVSGLWSANPQVDHVLSLKLDGGFRVATDQYKWYKDSHGRDMIYKLPYSTESK